MIECFPQEPGRPGGSPEPVDWLGAVIGFLFPAENRERDWWDDDDGPADEDVWVSGPC